MDNILQVINNNFQNSHIFLKNSWLEDRYNYYKSSINDINSIERKIKADICLCDIETIIDKEKVVPLGDDVSLNVKQTIIKRPIFCQIDAIANIGDASHKQEGNLDEIEKIDNKFLRTDEEQERSKKSEKEKVILKFHLNNGIEQFFGFEFDKIPCLFNFSFPKFQKIIIDKEVEVRRGIFYLKLSNFNLFM
jgi:hypothetical protein